MGGGEIGLERGGVGETFQRLSFAPQRLQRQAMVQGGGGGSGIDGAGGGKQRRGFFRATAGAADRAQKMEGGEIF